MIAIVDFGMGNLRSVEKAFEKVGFESVITDRPEIIDKADKIVLPGVGSFKDAIDGLQERKLVEPIVSHIKKGKAFLGICLGFQLLFTRSSEGGEHKELDIIAGEVTRFKQEKTEDSGKRLFGENNHKLKIPHMGWNEIQIKKKVPLLNGLPDNSFMYFVHSYYVIPSQNDIIATETVYGTTFVSMISMENFFATQFHPEKSQRYGLIILKNFVEL